MSGYSLAASITATAYDLRTRVAQALRTRIDNALVRHDAWFLVFVAVILGLGATLLAGMAIWCVVFQGKRFTGRWSLRNFGLSVYFECV